MTLLRDVSVDGVRLDVRIERDRVTAMGSLSRRAGEDIVDGGALLPGLHDAHVHLHALAAAAHSVDCRTADLAGTLRAAEPDVAGWIRGTGYTRDDLDVAALDALVADRPVRVQHRSGALWTVNSRGAAALGLGTADHPGIERDAAGRPTGRLWRADEWLRTRLPSAPPDLAAVGRQLARYGITAVTDATPDLDPVTYGAFASLPQRVTLLGVPIGDRAPQPLRTGPYKIVLADPDLPALPDLVDRIQAVRAVGRAVAVHCVTQAALMLLLAALEDAGPPHPGDRVEHAALIPADTIGELVRRGLTVVTQPGFVADRGDDYVRDVAELDDLYRVASLVEAGIDVRLSSDAPYGPLDPWAVIEAAVRRRTKAGVVVGPRERVTRSKALAAYAGAPVRPGTAADLVLVDQSGAVRNVWIGGRQVPTTAS